MKVMPSGFQGCRVVGLKEEQKKKPWIISRRLFKDTWKPLKNYRKMIAMQ
jgi:hypothetical protein